MTAGQAATYPVSVAAAGDALAGRLSQLSAAMRDRGARLGLRELLTAVRCLDAVDATSREDVRLALRAVLCSRQSDLERFDEAFTEVFGTAGCPGPVTCRCRSWARSSGRRCRVPHSGIRRPHGRRTRTPSTSRPRGATVELLLEKDFARYTEAEMALAYALMARLARRHPMRLSRRTRQSRRRGHIPDLRAHRAGVVANRRGTGSPPLAGADTTATTAGARLRRVRLDGPLLADAAAVHAGVGGGPATGRGVRVRHAADTDHPRA